MGKPEVDIVIRFKNEEFWLKKLKSRELSVDELTELATHQVNIIKEITIQLRAVK